MTRLPFPRFGLFTALLALAIQLGLAASVPNPASAFALAGVGVICHAGAERNEVPLAPAHRQAPDCALCPLCNALAAPAPTLPAAPVVRPPAMMFVAAMVVLPPATAPPRVIITAAQPRGPPSLA